MSKNTKKDNLDDIMNEIKNLDYPSTQNVTDIIKKTLSKWKCIANDCEGGRPIMNGCDLWCTICKADREGKRELFYLLNSIESTNSIASTSTVLSTSSALSTSSNLEQNLEQKNSRKFANVTSASYYTSSRRKNPSKYHRQGYIKKNSNKIKINNKQKGDGVSDTVTTCPYLSLEQPQIKMNTKESNNGLLS